MTMAEMAMTKIIVAVSISMIILVIIHAEASVGVKERFSMSGSMHLVMNDNVIDVAKSITRISNRNKCIGQ